MSIAHLLITPFFVHVSGLIRILSILASSVSFLYFPEDQQLIETQSRLEL